MKRRLLQILAAVLCVASLVTCQVFAEGSEDDGIMPLWDIIGSVYCEVYFEGSTGVAVGSISTRNVGTEIYARLELYRTHWLFGDTLVTYWAEANYDSVSLGGSFPPEDGQKYKVVLEVTTIYDGVEETRTFTDTATYHASDS